MKSKLFLITTLTSLLFGANNLGYGKEYNFYQTTQMSKTSKTQTETIKKKRRKNALPPKKK